MLFVVAKARPALKVVIFAVLRSKELDREEGGGILRPSSLGGTTGGTVHSFR